MAGTPIVNPQQRALQLAQVREQFKNDPGILRKMVAGLTEIPHKAWETGELAKSGKDTFEAMAYGLNAMSGGMFGAAKGAGLGSGPFFSTLRQGVEAAPFEKAPAAQWAGTLKNMPGIKQEELQYTGFEDFLKSKPQITKQEATDFLEANKVDVQELMKAESTSAAHTARYGRLYSERESLLEGIGNRRIDETTRASYQGRLAAVEDELEAMRVGGISDSSGTKFSQWQMPGGENYKELLLTMPHGGAGADAKRLSAIRDRMEEISNKPLSEHATQNLTDEWDALNAERKQLQETAQPAPKFTSSHFDEPNVLAHVRFNDRVDANGKKTLFIEEIQSDWHQKGRKQGYQQGLPSTEGWKATKDDIFGTWTVLDAEGKKRPFHTGDWRTRFPSAEAAIKSAAQFKATEGVPDAPFKTSWPDLALKRMIKHAVDNGYDSVSWTPGKVQAARYDLSKHVAGLDYSKRGVLTAYKPGKGHQVLFQKEVPEAELADHVGKDVAQKLVDTEADASGIRSLRGMELRVGGEGMNAFYDKMLPAAANKLGKKYGAKVTTTNFGKIKNRYQELDQRIARGETLTDAEMRELGTLDANPGSGKGYDGEVWSLPITDAMRAEVGKKGVPLFTGGAPVPTPEERAKQLQNLPAMMGNRS